MASKTDLLTLELVDGTRVVVPDTLENITSYVLREQADWFEDEIKFLRHIVQPGETVVDIGANYGVYALTLARLVGPSGQLWAFEPATETAKLLRASSAVNGTSWLHVLQQAVSDREGSSWLHNPGQAELNCLVGTMGDPAMTDTGEVVSVTTLDRSLERFGWTSVDLLKIDAEGEEARILQGGARFFRELSPLVMFEVKAGAELHLGLVERFAELGYLCFRLIPGLNLLSPFTAQQDVDGFLLNLFAAKPDRVAFLAAAGWLIDDDHPAVIAEEEPDSESWLNLLQKLPYARSLLSVWQRPSLNQERPVVERALAWWSESQDADLPIARRFAALRQSHQLLQTLCQPGSPVVYWASLARVALALGEREQAVRALHAILVDFESGLGLNFEDPFLCPHPEFEPVEPVESIQDWLQAAVLLARENLASYSGFYTGESALPGLVRVSALGYEIETVQRRTALLKERCTSRQMAIESDSSLRDWFGFLGLGDAIRCIDVGALDLGAKPQPWTRWAHLGCSQVVFFDPLQDACEKFNQQAHDGGAAIHYLPLLLGDGAEHTLYITSVSRTPSLFPLARHTVDLFGGLGCLMKPERQVRIATYRLDDIPQAAAPDFLKLNVLGSELMILQNAQTCLSRVSVVQCGVGLLDLFEGQPLMADVDAYLRSQGFCFLRYASMGGRPLKPLQKKARPEEEISQMLWADAIYVRDFRQCNQWSARQLQAASFILHELYQAFDLVALLLRELDQRSNSRLCDCYLAALMSSQLL